MRDPLLGTTLAQYELQDQLGAGGMAIVYRGFQPSLGRAVAVKVLPPGLLPDPTLPARFRREARLAANLMHPNIVPVYDFGEWDGYLYIVMALVSGGTLKDRMETPLPLQAVVRLVGQVADALGYAHNQGVYHRDVKPANILLASSEWAMLSDFGIARALGETTRLTQPYGTLGTPVYMAPEQWLGHEIDGRADTYSLGAMLFELLAGRPPFTAMTAQGLMRQHLESPVPPLVPRDLRMSTALQEVVRTALAKRPEDRFQHASQFKDALEAAVQSDQVAYGPTSPTRPVTAGLSQATPYLGRTVRNEELRHRPPVKRGRQGSVPTLPILLGLMLVLVVVLAVGMGYLLAGGRASTEATAPAKAGPAAVGQGPSVPTQTGAQVSPTMTPGAVPAPQPTAAPKPTPRQPRDAAPTSPPKPAAEPTVIRPASVPTSAPATTFRADPRFTQMERRVGDYFQALNAGDYAKAHATCCTPSWRSRFPLDEWQKNFTGVEDLRYSTPFRYPTVEPSRVVADVDYSFVSRGQRRYFVLRWTFVPVGGEWLADDAQAFPQ